jgi:hypothetical protein
MIDNAVVSKLVALAGRVRTLIDTKGNGITLENAFDHPDVVGLRDAILGLLGDDGEVAGLVRASVQLGEEFDQLHHQPLTDELVPRLGSIAGARHVLSTLAASRAAEPLEIFRYTVSTAAPYIEAAARVGAIALAAAV